MKISVLSIVLALGTCVGWAGTVCPQGNGANPFPHSPDAGATGCNVVITINANGTTSVVVKDATPYENSEDVLVGVVNNSASAVPSINLSGSGIFGLEGDGICIYTFVGSSYCTPSQVAGTDPGDYYGPNTTFTITDANTGRVNFTTPLATGGSTYFSLEGVPSANLIITVGPPVTTPPPVVVAGAPALSFWAILMLASMLAGYAIWTLRREHRQQ
jgi:hypothetical protein